jgi:hypothetical protein
MVLLRFKDNQGTIDLTNNPVHHKRTKHIDVKSHYMGMEKVAPMATPTKSCVQRPCTTQWVTSLVQLAGLPQYCRGR